jgi:hypothetical protein
MPTLLVCHSIPISERRVSGQEELVMCQLAASGTDRAFSGF